MLGDKLKNWLTERIQNGLVYYHPYRIDDALIMFENDRLGLIAYPDENKKLIFQNITVWNGSFSMLNNINTDTELEKKFYKYVRENSIKEHNPCTGEVMYYIIPWKTLPDELNLWEQLDKRAQELLREEYKNECTAYQLALEKYFGKDNLVPPPPINNWEDLLKVHPELDKKLEDFSKSIEDFAVTDYDYLIAQFKIIYSINYGYGGTIKKYEWKDQNIMKWRIVVNSMTSNPIISSTVHDTGELLTFRSKEQAERFKKYNVNLIKQFLKR